LLIFVCRCLGIWARYRILGRSIFRLLLSFDTTEQNLFLSNKKMGVAWKGGPELTNCLNKIIEQTSKLKTFSIFFFAKSKFQVPKKRWKERELFLRGWKWSKSEKWTLKEFQNCRTSHYFSSTLIYRGQSRKILPFDFRSFFRFYC
jgi:hypothetical protein